MNITTGRVSLLGDLQPRTATSIVHLETHDVFLQARALPMWQQDYMQISKGAFHGGLSDISLGAIQLFRETMDKAVDQHGQPWANSFAVGVPVRVEGDGFWCGDKLETDSIFFLRPNSELKFKTPLNSDIYVAVIDLEMLSRYAEDIEEVSIGHVCGLSGVKPASHQLCETLRNNFLCIFEGVSENPSALNDGAVLQALNSDVMHALFSGLCVLGKIPPHNPGQFVHRHIVEKAKEYILSRKSQPPTVIDVCQELHISRRTLHYAFQKVLNINPVTFLRYVRLHGARYEFLTSPPGKLLISEIAAHWGFWHLGMFCTYYKELFGETPSSTVRRAAF